MSHAFNIYRMSEGQFERHFGLYNALGWSTDKECSECVFLLEQVCNQFADPVQWKAFLGRTRPEPRSVRVVHDKLDPAASFDRATLPNAWMYH